MAKRRKFLVGLGALASGSAAAVGTGAFSTASAARTAEVNVASDSSGFVELRALNSTYASGTGDGQLELDFNSDSDIGIFDGQAQGLNPDSTYYFDKVFEIANVTGKPYVVIEKSEFNVDNLELIVNGEDPDGPTAGTSLLAEDYTDVNNLPKLEQPDLVNVDIKIETKGDSTMGAVGGTLTVHVASVGDQSELSDVIGGSGT